jgi:hypothetical protein
MFSQLAETDSIYGMTRTILSNNIRLDQFMATANFNYQTLHKYEVKHFNLRFWNRDGLKIGPDPGIRSYLIEGASVIECSPMAPVTEMEESMES